MKLGKQLLTTALFTSVAMAFAGGNLKAQDQLGSAPAGLEQAQNTQALNSIMKVGGLANYFTPSAATDASLVQWSPLATPKVGGQEQAFSFRSYCSESDRKHASWVVEIENNMPDSYAVSNKTTSLGSIESGRVLEFTIPGSNCKKQPEITAVEQVGGDQTVWYVYSYKDGNAKGKLHDDTDPGWLDIAAAIAEGMAAGQQ